MAGESERGTAVPTVGELIDAAPEGMFLADLEGRIVMVNRQMESMFGYPQGALVGKLVELLVPESRRADHRVHRADFARVPEVRRIGGDRSLLGRCRDGTEFPIQVTIGPLRATQGHFTVGIVRDDSERIEADHRLLEAEREIAVADDRRRIARDLHDRVIQRLFTSGMAVQSVLGRVVDPTIQRRLQRAIDEIDTAILDVRSSIFELAVHGNAPSLRSQVLELCTQVGSALGVAPIIRFAGPVDMADSQAGEALLAVLREHLFNLGRNAGARAITVTVAADEGLALIVDDDAAAGEEPGESVSRGLLDMTAKTRELGGTVDVHPNGRFGTRLEWRVPCQ